MLACGTIFLLLIPLNSANCDNGSTKALFERSINQYTFRLMKKINQETQSNFVVSPLSSWMLLSAMSLGASKTTLSEIQKVARLHPDKCLSNLYLEFAKSVPMELANVTASTFERSSTIFFDKSLSIKNSFIGDVTNVGLCDVQRVSFADVIKTTADINEHVRNATNNTIDEIVKVEHLGGVLTVMLDALYFAGAWKIPFPFEDTTTDVFYNITGEPIGDVSLMYLCEVYNVTRIAQIQSKVLELPYGNDTRFSMLIFLPRPNLSIKTLINLMPAIRISSIFHLFKMYGPRLITVQIPRFKISSSIDLKKHLTGMGIKDLFDYQQASFPDISEQQLFVSNFIQKADVEVTEDGVVDAAPTVSMFDSRLWPEQFTANRPFMFMIVDRNSHIPMFTGVYTEPSIFRK